MISTILLLLSSAVLGVFLGTQIAEAFLIVPYWKVLSPDDFFDLHKKFAQKLYDFYAPLTILATVVPLVTVGYHFIIPTKEKLLFAFLALSTLMYFLTYFIYFKKANNAFKNREISDNALSKEIVMWGNWHWGRIAFEFIAFVIVLVLLFKN